MSCAAPLWQTIFPQLEVADPRLTMDGVLDVKKFLGRILLRSVLPLVLMTGAVSATAGTKVAVDTSAGKLVIELADKEAPITVENFIKYVRADFYSGVFFHRVIKGFVIQAGGFDAQMNSHKVPSLDTSPIVNESNNGLRNSKYSLSMARTSDPNSATSQFFINLADNASLDYNPSEAPGNGYAVFGSVISGQETVDKIATVATSTRGRHRDVPKEDLVINSARIIEE